MKLTFEDLNIDVFLKEGLLFFKKEEILKNLGYTEEQFNNVLMVLGNKEKTNLAVLSNLGFCYDKKDFYDTMKDLIEENEKQGLKLLNRQKLQSEDGREIEILNFTNGENNMIVSLSYIGEILLMTTCNSTKNNLNNGYELIKDIMTQLFEKK